MKNLSIYAFSIFFLAILAPLFAVNAFSVEIGDVENSNDSLWRKISIVADPPNDAKAVRVYFTVTGAEILEYTQGSSKFLVLGTCENNQAFYNGHVCVDAASTTGSISKGEELFEIIVELDNRNAEIGFEVSDESGYLLANNDFNSVNNIVINDESELEDVYLKNYRNGVLVLIGTISIVSIVLLIILFRKQKKLEEQMLEESKKSKKVKGKKKSKQKKKSDS